MTCRLTPYLAVRDARAAIAWYGEALGARLVGETVVMDDDRIGHAEIDVGGARVADDQVGDQIRHPLTAGPG